MGIIAQLVYQVGWLADRFVIHYTWSGECVLVKALYSRHHCKLCKINSLLWTLENTALHLCQHMRKPRFTERPSSICALAYDGVQACLFSIICLAPQDDYLYRSSHLDVGDGTAGVGPVTCHAWRS